MKTFEVIFSHRSSPEEGLLCFVEASSPGSAQDECNEAVLDPSGIFQGYEFTIWPVAIKESGS
jgi:hypothetical protein